MEKFVQALIGILLAHDPKKYGISNRAEGTLEAITALAETVPLAPQIAQRLGDSIIQLCQRYNQFELIGRGASAKPWPTNRYALKALEALGIPRPV